MADDVPDWARESSSAEEVPDWAKGAATPAAPSFTDKLMQTWPVRAAQNIYHAVTLPGDVATGQGNVTPTVPGMWSDEDEARLQMNNAAIVDRAHDLANVASPVSPGARIGEGIFGVAQKPSVQPKVAAPTATELHEAAAGAGRGYKAPEVSAVKMKSEAGPQLFNEIDANFNHPDVSISDAVAPQTYAVLNKMTNVPDDSFLTVANLRGLRRQLGRVVENNLGPNGGTERFAAQSAQRHIDEFLANMPEKYVIEGDPEAAARILKQANANYSAMKTAQDFDARLIRAQMRAAAANSGMNIGNTIRQRMADILTNPKLQRGFTANEIDQMKSLVEGTRFSNALRFGSNIAGGGGGLGSTLLGIMTHGWAPVAGYLLRKASNATTRRAAEDISEAVRMRSPLGQERLAATPLERPQVTAPWLHGAARTGIEPAIESTVDLGRRIAGVPVQAHADTDEDSRKARGAEQHQAGGRVGYQQNPRAKGGKVEASHQPPFNPEKIGAKRAKNGHWYLKDPKRPGRYLIVLPKKRGLSRVVH